MLAEVAKQKGISLCGIQRDQTTAVFSQQGLKPPDAILLASDLSQAGVTGSLTSINLSDNNLTWWASHGRAHGREGITELAAALGVNGSLTSVDLSENNLTNRGLDMTGIKELAAALGVNGSLTKMSLAENKLEEKGTKAICEALEQNKTLKELDISGYPSGSNIGGLAGAKHVAKMLGVNGSLIKCDLRQNSMGEEEEASIRKSVQGKAGFVLHV